MVPITEISSTLTEFTFSYWVVGTEYTNFQKTYMKYLVWDENAQAFRIMALGCLSAFGCIIICCVVACVKKCCDKNKVQAQ